MPFFIPLLLGASLISMIPSFLPQEDKRAQEVIRQDGNNYFNRQTWRTGNPAGTSQEPYPLVQSNSGNSNTKKSTPYQTWLIYGGLAIAALITIKFLVGRRN